MRYQDRQNWDEDLGRNIIVGTTIISLIVFSLIIYHLIWHTPKEVHKKMNEKKITKLKRKTEPLNFDGLTPSKIDDSPNLVYYIEDDNLIIVIPSLSKYPTAYENLPTAMSGKRKWIASTRGDKLLIRQTNEGSASTNITLNLNLWVKEKR